MSSYLYSIVSYIPYFNSGSNLKPNVLSVQEVIPKLKQQISFLEIKEKNLTEKIHNEHTNAQKFISRQDDPSAFICISRKKIFQEQLKTITNSINTLNQQIHLLETADMNSQSMKIMKTGSETVKEIHAEMNIDAFEDIISDINEQMDISKELTAAISQPLNTCDDNDIMSELEDMKTKTFESNFLSSRQTMIPLSSMDTTKMLDPSLLSSGLTQNKGLTGNSIQKQNFDTQFYTSYQNQNDTANNNSYRIDTQPLTGNPSHKYSPNTISYTSNNSFDRNNVKEAEETEDDIMKMEISML